MLLPGKYRRTKIINVLLPGNAGGGNKKNITIKKRRTGRTLQREYYYRGNFAGRKPSCYYRGNVINKSYKILLPGNRGSTTIKNTLYKTYDINKILPPRKYYKRKL